MKRVAIVTGAGRGIGEATAHALARDGHTVALADLNAAEARRTAGALPGDGHAAFAVDVVDERSVEALFDAVEAQLGPVAVLACVAGGPFLTPGRRPSIIETTTENWIRTEALNARGPFLCIRAMLLRRMRSPVADGRIITVSSMSGITPESPTGPAYSAAKAAVIHLTRYAALEAAPSENRFPLFRIMLRPESRPRRQPFENRRAFGDLVEGLLVDSKDRHLRTAEDAWVVERTDLQDHRAQAWPARRQMGAALGAELARHRVFKIAARELLGHALYVAEARRRHEHEHIRRAATDVLALATMTLRPQHRFALGRVAHLTAVASTFQFHIVLPPAIDGDGSRNPIRPWSPFEGCLRTATMRKVRIVLIPSPLFPATPARPDTRQCTAYCCIKLETTGPRTADGYPNPYGNRRGCTASTARKSGTSSAFPHRSQQPQSG